ncbi:MAG: sulfatase-like hydrolase/transferase, partial [Alistipes sp.]|nr:sulfatase-like hydrolase/transferase [Alistipes sp.]
KYTSLYSYTVVGTSSNYWRQDNVNLSLGIANLFDKQDIQALTGNSYSGALDWAGDKDIFNFAGQKLPSDKKPFFAVAISTDMHAPYTYDATIDCNITFENITDPALHEYMRRARYLDDQIAAFIAELKDRGLYDDTLIVVTSDHQVPSAYCSDAMRESLSPYIPAIFINTGADWTEQNKRNKDVVFCHSQVYPTMLQLMGLRPEKYAGLFPPMTNIEATQEYDFANCAYETTTDKRIKQIYDIEEKIIRSSYFGVME